MLVFQSSGIFVKCGAVLTLTVRLTPHTATVVGRIGTIFFAKIHSCILEKYVTLTLYNVILQNTIMYFGEIPNPNPTDGVFETSSFRVDARLYLEPPIFTS